jgi:FkbM family methyltransferase
LLAATPWFVDWALHWYGRLPYHPGKWRLVAAFEGAARPAWGIRRVVRHRVHLQLDTTDFVGRSIYYGIFEPREIQALKRLIKPGWVAVDVGANLGYHTLILASLVGSNGRVYAFEPVTETYGQLMQNISLNPYANILPLHTALLDRPQTIQFVVPLHNKGKARMASGNLGTETVTATTLDAFCDERGLQQLDFLKVDIEGSEHLFLRGAACTLARFRPLLLIELNASLLAQLDSSPSAIAATLQGLGYTLRVPSWRGLTPLRALPKDQQYFNVFAFPPVRVPPNFVK